MGFKKGLGIGIAGVALSATVAHFALEKHTGHGLDDRITAALQERQATNDEVNNVIEPEQAPTPTQQPSDAGLPNSTPRDAAEPEANIRIEEPVQPEPLPEAGTPDEPTERILQREQRPVEPVVLERTPLSNEDLELRPYQPTPSEQAVLDTDCSSINRNRRRTECQQAQEDINARIQLRASEIRRLQGEDQPNNTDQVTFRSRPPHPDSPLGRQYYIDRGIDPDTVTIVDNTVVIRDSEGSGDEQHAPLLDPSRQEWSNK